jgi:hypothetical protein
MAHIFEWAHEHLPVVETVAHAAGALGYDLIADVTPEAFWAICQPKARALSSSTACSTRQMSVQVQFVLGVPGATLMIHAQVLGGEACCHTILPVAQRHFFSSTAAAWSQPGACHYSAANAYLDTLSQQCRWAAILGSAHACIMQQQKAAAHVTAA